MIVAAAGFLLLLFAAIDQFVFQRVGVHLICYAIADWLGMAAILRAALDKFLTIPRFNPYLPVLCWMCSEEQSI